MLRRVLVLPLVTLALLGTLSFSCLSQTAEQRNSQAFAALSAADTLDYEDSRQYSFSKTFRNPNEQRTVAFDPHRSRAKQWQLISIDGEKPDQETLEDYQALVRRFQTMQETAKQHGNADRLLSQVDEDSIRFLPERSHSDAEADYFHFQPKVSKDNKDFHALLSGTLEIGRACQCLMEVEIKNTAPFKPKFGVEIDKIIERYSFMAAKTPGKSVLVNVYRNSQGSALFSKINSQEFEIYRNITQVQ